MDTLTIIGRGRTAKVYLDGDRAIKFYTSRSLEEVEQEAALQIFAYEAGLPVPKVYGVSKRDGGIAFEMDYIEPISTSIVKNKLGKLLENFIGLQTKVHSVLAPELMHLDDKLRQKINSTPHIHDEVKEYIIDRIKMLSEGKMNLCHGDMHPNNVLESNGTYWIIDWVDACAGDPVADACRTYLIIKQHIPRFAGIYSRKFCKATGVKQIDILNWLPVMAAARVCEVDSEHSRNFLLSIVNSPEYRYNEDLFKQI